LDTDKINVIVIVIVIAKLLFNCNLIVIGQNVIGPCLLPVDGHVVYSIISSVTAAMIRTTDLDRQTTVTHTVTATTVRYLAVNGRSASTQVYFPVYATLAYLLTYLLSVTVRSECYVQSSIEFRVIKLECRALTE